MIKKIIPTLLIVFVLNSCSGSSPVNIPITETPVNTLSVVPTMTTAIPSQVPTMKNLPTDTSEPTITATNQDSGRLVCSPVEGVLIDEIAGMVFNPFYPPVEGSDDPHQGVDLSDVDVNSQIARTGAGVNSVVSGKVIMVVKNRFPYGNAILIETPFEELPVNWQTTITNNPQSEPYNKTPALTCPQGWNEMSDSNSIPALFTLYAHLKNVPDLTAGELVNCGEAIGKIGMSGNALAPHVHIEMRYGPPSGLSGSMAHYDVSASIEEMSNYCRWRVSGWYRLIDPFSLLFQN